MSFIASSFPLLKSFSPYFSSSYDKLPLLSISRDSKSLLRLETSYGFSWVAIKASTIFFILLKVLKVSRVYISGNSGFGSASNF